MKFQTAAWHGGIADKEKEDEDDEFVGKLINITLSLGGAMMMQEHKLRMEKEMVIVNGDCYIFIRLGNKSQRNGGDKMQWRHQLISLNTLEHRTKSSCSCRQQQTRKREMGDKERSG